MKSESAPTASSGPPGPLAPPVQIRAYRSEDARATLEVFTAAVLETASADYTPEQLEAWARPQRRDLTEWNAAMLSRRSIVAECRGAVVGFSDVSRKGYIDMVYVAPEHTRRGIASSLMQHIETLARREQQPLVTAHVSLTARPFFEGQGFVVETELSAERGGVQLTNFLMRKRL